MRLSSRSYPHPVVGNGDDVPSVGFQATIESSLRPPDCVLEVSINCGSPTLKKWIEKGSACYMVHVECGRTLYRKSFPSQEPRFRIPIPAQDLNGVVELTSLIVATRAIRRYEVPEANEAYGGAVFAVEPGDILACGEPRDFEQRTRDPLRRIGSIVEIVCAEKPGEFAMEATYNDPKIKIVLCKTDHANYAALAGKPHLRSLIATALVVPVLVDAVYKLRGEAKEDYAEYKWAEVIGRRMDELGLQDAEPLKVAQQLYGMPVSRAFQSAQASMETSASEDQ